MPLFPAEMESERLRYERLHPDEFDPFELYEHVRAGAPGIDEVTRYVSWEPYETPKEAFDWVQRCGEQFDAGEDATYVIRPRYGEDGAATAAEQSSGERSDPRDGAGEFGGLAGLHPDWDRRRATLGTWFRRPFWGRGYSGERAARLLELAFDRLDLEVVTVSHDPENDRSRRAIEKYVERFGGRKEGAVRNDILIDGEPRDTVRYSISREEWAATRE